MTDEAGGSVVLADLLNIGTPKIIYFPFGINGKLMVLDVPIF